MCMFLARSGCRPYAALLLGTTTIFTNLAALMGKLAQCWGPNGRGFFLTRTRRTTEPWRSRD